ncbi:hypothetical protein BpHYR1_035253 [Brachionus plicatilis]|uniref:Uncharacterized protein n=1 Tax=Brachionus plicatilis TaxID=10195 RepID=A0A3M7QFC2_BRAPC|nr:hypothetical protein BpHYR1_035253 [Brachionus plicatilis]
MKIRTENEEYAILDRVNVYLKVGVYDILNHVLKPLLTKHLPDLNPNEMNKGFFHHDNPVKLKTMSSWMIHLIKTLKPEKFHCILFKTGSRWSRKCEKNNKKGINHILEELHTLLDERYEAEIWNTSGNLTT